jgi:hypothetical protein
MGVQSGGVRPIFNFIQGISWSRTGHSSGGSKAAISAELSGIFERLGSSALSWWSRIEKLSKGRLLGRYASRLPRSEVNQASRSLSRVTGSAASQSGHTSAFVDAQAKTSDS